MRGGFANWQKLLAEVRASGDPFVYLARPDPGSDDKLSFCYVDTRRRLGHYTEYLWWDDKLNGMPMVPNVGA